MERPENTLAIADVQSPTWAKVRDYLQQRLAQLREENDSGDTEIITTRRRGRIAEIKDMLALEEEARHGGADR